MTSMVQLKCWLCPESFGTNKELKNHASSSKHSVMRVICPWCFDKQSDYRTSAELLKHVNRRHQYVTEETKKGDFFSEGNGYWLSINPQDYRKVAKPNDYRSTTAITTRAAVERWVGKLKKAGCKTIDQWREGWDLAKEKTVPTYSPSRPIIPEARLRLMDLELSSAGHLAYLVDDESTIGDVWYKVEILPTVFGDRRSLELLMRRLQRKKTRTIPRNFEHLAGDRPGILRASAKELGIDEQHVGRIYRSIRAMSIPPMKRKRHQLEELEKELGMSDDIELREPETTNSQTSTSTTDSQASEETTIGSQSPRESITTSQTPDISQTREENTSQTHEENTISQTHEENTTSLTPAPEETNTNPTSEEPTTSQTSDPTTETSDEITNQLSDHQPANQIQDDSPVEDAPQNMETDITFSEEMPSTQRR